MCQVQPAMPAVLAVETSARDHNDIGSDIASRQSYTLLQSLPAQDGSYTAEFESDSHAANAANDTGDLCLPIPPLDLRDLI